MVLQDGQEQQRKAGGNAESADLATAPLGKMRLNLRADYPELQPTTTPATTTTLLEATSVTMLDTPVI